MFLEQIPKGRERDDWSVQKDKKQHHHCDSHTGWGRADWKTKTTQQKPAPSQIKMGWHFSKDKKDKQGNSNVTKLRPKNLSLSLRRENLKRTTWYGTTVCRRIESGPIKKKREGDT